MPDRFPSPHRGRLRPRALWLGVALALAAGAAMAESGILLKETELRKEPLGSADVLKQLAAKEEVQITARQGAWAGVNTLEGLEGWVRILNLRTGSGEQKGRSGFGAMASAFATGSSGQAVSTGVKGLTADQLRNAAPNWSDAEAIDQYRVDDSEAASFGQAGQLQSQQIAYLPEETGNRRKK